MTLTFIESPRFPDSIATWAKGGAGYNTTVVIVNSGYEQRNINWSQARAQYNIAQAWRTLQASGQTSFLGYDFIQFFNNVQGMGVGFRFKDFNDYEVLTTNGVLGLPQSGGSTVITGIANGNQIYQLYKNYFYGSNTFSRIIPKPVASSPIPVIYNNGTPLVLGTNYTIDTTTGLVTLIATSTATITGISNTNPGVVTTSAAHGFTTGQLIYLSGVVGMTQVNNIAFTITDVSSTQFSIGINTSSYPIYTSGGTASLFLQPSSTLTWSGNFDVPVRFDSDNLMGGQTQDGTYELENLSLIELRI